VPHEEFDTTRSDSQLLGYDKRIEVRKRMHEAMHYLKALHFLKGDESHLYESEKMLVPKVSTTFA